VSPAQKKPAKQTKKRRPKKADDGKLDTAAKAKKAGKVWVSASFSGGKDTPFLKACSISMKGPVEPDAAFCAYLLLMGHTIESATAKVAEVKAAQGEGS